MTNDLEHKKYIGPVGKKELRQFQRAASKRLTRFEDELAKCLDDGSRYYPLSDCKKRPGRNHLDTVKVAEGRMTLNANSLFANCLEKAEAVWEPRKAAIYPAPSGRVRLGPLQVYTFEFDELDLDFFRLQLSWLRSNGRKPTDCPMGQFFRTCSQWTDFRGITVCWSGHKSLHIHVVFDTRAYVSRFGEPDANLREGLIAHWKMLEASVLTDLRLSSTSYRPDQSLRLPEQYRRLPNAFRLIDKGNHLLRVPVGTIIQQITLWEMWRERACSKATALFHSPTLFAPPAPKIAVRKQRAATGLIVAGSNYTPAEITHCQARLKEIYPDTGWPRLDRIAYESGYWKAHFFNSSADKNPSSFIREDYRKMAAAGQDAEAHTSVFLDAPLGEMMAQWAEELRGPSDSEVSIDGPIHVNRARIEKAFAVAMDQDEARKVLDEHLPVSVARNALLLIQAPEGASKTSTIMRHHPHIANNLTTIDGSHGPSPRQALYAFGDYDTAENKCADFNECHVGSDYIGMLRPSFSRTYKEVSEALGLTMLTHQEVARMGHPSLLAAIRSLQPQVIEKLREMHSALWAKIADRQPVWFSVHQVVHGWHQSTPSRLMWAKSYWTADEAEKAELCREETRLSLVVHDEIKASTFVETLCDAERVWIDGLRNSASGNWAGQTAAKREDLFHHFNISNPIASEMKFDRAMMLANLHYETEVMTADTAEYNTDFGDRDLYAARHGKRWWVVPCNWWREVGAQRVVFLTTEEVPTAVAQKADPNIHVLRLDAPLIARDTIAVHPKSSITSQKLKAEVEEWRSKHGAEWFAVSNKLGGADNSLTHVRARGSNVLIGKKIVQTMTFMSPNEYEQIQALNAWCGRKDLVRLRHIDECNQTAGRNLGFRHCSGAEHALLISTKLLRLLEPALGYSRYEFRIHETANQRRTIKRRKLATLSRPGAVAIARPAIALRSYSGDAAGNIAIFCNAGGHAQAA